jgi:hypothetical protein
MELRREHRRGIEYRIMLQVQKRMRRECRTDDRSVRRWLRRLCECNPQCSEDAYDFKG